ncbi:MAG: hypothetical protein HYR71_10560, partial [Chloroflexi bacterium]|nr:hypothetical protein [Chloroflexota bacterium]
MAVIDQLHRLESVGLVRLAQSQPELEYLFRHALVQDAAYQSLLRREQRDLHRSVGELLERAHAERPEVVAPVLARHFGEAGDEPRALKYFALAADDAARRYANDEAIMHYSRAIELARRAGPERAAELCGLYLRRGRAQELSARDREALAGYEQLEALGRERGDRAMELAALVARTTLYASAREMRDPERVQALSAQALGLARALGDRASEIEILRDLMHDARERSQFQEAARYGEQSMALARELGLREALGYTLNDLSLTYMMLGQLARAQTVRQEAAALWRELGNQPMLSENLSYAAITDVITGKLEAALAGAGEARQISRAIGNWWGEAISLMPAAMAGLRLGNIADALTAMNESIRLAEQAGLAPPQVQMRADLAMVQSEMGMIQPAGEMAQLALAKAEESFPIYRLYALAALAHVYLLKGQLAEAAALVEKGIPDLEREDLFPMSRLALVITAVELGLAQGDYGRALFFIEMTLPMMRGMGARYDLPVVLLLKAQALAGLGQPAEARAAAAEAR